MELQSINAPAYMHASRTESYSKREIHKLSQRCMGNNCSSTTDLVRTRQQASVRAADLHNKTFQEVQSRGVVAASTSNYASLRKHINASIVIETQQCKHSNASIIMQAW